jgi:hypothetical protein
MSDDQMQQKLHAYGQWRGQTAQALQRYRAWLDKYGLNEPQLDESITGMMHSLATDRVTVAFAAEFSRGKTELINALFFSHTGVRLLPSAPGRTTMCPTEIFYDEAGSYIRLLPIDTRLNERPLSEYKLYREEWTQVDLDCNSVPQMQQAFKELAAVKRVSVAQATTLGLYTPQSGGQVADDGTVEIPCWRHALISFPQPLLREGLAILDTPGLNALGSEPELTLSMLPNAQAVVFVLAADTGVTKSDMDMWQQHVRNCSVGHNKSLAVVLNKIDAMWDELQDENALEQAIRAQADSTAKTLEIKPQAIFPLSAKQALLGKIKGDAALLGKSRLAELERYLAEEVVGERRVIMIQAVGEKVGYLVQDSANVLAAQIQTLDKQLAEMRSLDSSNHSTIKKLMVETREQQGRYMTSVEDFQASRRVLSVQARMLVDALSLERVDGIIKQTRRDMASSLTTIGMKGVMKKVLEDLHGVANRADDIAGETQQLVQAIYKKFEDEHGFAASKPSVFAMRKYQLDLDQLFAEGEAFRHSAAAALLEQSVVIHRLYGTIIARARDILVLANKEAANWGAMVLSPLVLQIKDHKRAIDTRLEMLRKINESTQSLDESIAQLEQQLAPLRQQYHELEAVLEALPGTAGPLGKV